MIIKETANCNMYVIAQHIFVMGRYEELYEALGFSMILTLLVWGGGGLLKRV